MNANLFRTLLAVLTIAIGFAEQIFGCSVDAVTGATTCTAPWLTPQFALYIAMGLAGAHMVIKFMTQGWAGAVNKTVPVVPPSEAKVGVVTPAQVAAPGPSK